MQQSDKSVKGIKSALSKLREMNSNTVGVASIGPGLRSLYSGFWAAVIGSVPSSAIYFGTYEASKLILNDNLHTYCNRQTINALAAMTGNLVSSVVFVPKEALKQKLQAIKTCSVPWLGKKSLLSYHVSLPDVVKNVYQTDGLKGFYPNYRATLLRNIPSAVVSLFIVTAIFTAGHII